MNVKYRGFLHSVLTLKIMPYMTFEGILRKLPKVMKLAQKWKDF
jgi:hypothetical protein